ncbi:MAG: hypothetical protein ACJASQ_002271 [Crocinitomicaceae bacterium]|jgi:hypothetical protein
MSTSIKIKESIETSNLKLPFDFETEKLLIDLSAATNGSWTPHFNTSDYTGNWKAIALYSRGGEETNIFPMTPSKEAFMETNVLKSCPYFKKVIESFNCEVVSARLLNLSPGAEIKPHYDHGIGYQDGVFRIHVPITTNEEVKFILEGELLQMLPGECWYTNVSLTHSVTNKGNEDRVHLVIDCQRNDWSDAMFFSLAPESSFELIREEILSDETIRMMLTGLKERNENPELIQELQARLKG